MNLLLSLFTVCAHHEPFAFTLFCVSSSWTICVHSLLYVHNMNLLLSISMTAKRTIFLFLQEAKTLTLLITLHHFYTEILQGRTNQIDNIQLYETWLFLTILYVGHSILKQISKARIPLSPKKMIKLLQVFPFFTECFLLLKIIRCKVKMYKLKRAIQKKIDNISKTDTTSNNWKLIGKERRNR